MSRTIKEEASVKMLDDGLLLIHYDHVFEYGVDLSGDLICQASAAGWIADQIEEGVDLWSAPDIDQDMPPDHFRVYFRGGERGEDINVNIHNLRDPNAPYGRTYAFSGISPGVAKNLAAQLRAIKPQ